ncbi:hypothetical protein J2T13_004933 [Paenibacillus sp. DS2015]
MLVDPFFQEIPWELIYDDKGRQIGEVYMIRPWLKPVRKEVKQHDSVYGVRRASGARETKSNPTRRIY